VDTRGLTWTYTYSGSHLLHEVRDPENKVLERTFYTVVDGQPKASLQQDGEGRTVAQIDYLSNGQRRIVEAGRVYTDTYDSRNLLTGQTDALNRTQSYTLDDSFNRTQAVDIRNQPITYTRTPLGLTQAITNSLNQASQFGYDSRNNLAVVTETNGTHTDYSYDSQNNLLQIATVSGTISYAYNSAGQVISVTNRRSQTTRYGYDAVGNLTVITDAQGYTATFSYDSLGRVETATNARGMVSRYQYDAADNLRFLTLNYQTTACPASECNLTTEYQYDLAGRLVWTIDPANRQSKREYDEAGRLEKVILNYQDGVYSNSAPDEDLITRYAYDSYGRLEKLFETLAAGSERETRLEYDSLSRVNKVIFNYVAGGSASDQNLTTTYAYQDTTVPSVVTVTDPTGLVTRSEYDALGRLEKRIDNYKTTACPATECNLTTRYEYDSVGNLTALIDPANHRTEYEYDPLHRLIGATENHSGSGAYSGIPDQNITTRYQYDNEGNLSQLTINNEQLTIYRYDELNRLEELENALGHITAYTYDPVGNLSQMTRPDTSVINYQYDLLNRLTTLNYPSPETDVTFGYDKLSRRTVMTDTTGTTSYSYDDLDRLTGLTDGNNQSVGYSYDARGNRTQMSYPDSKTVSYGYDAADRPTGVTPSWDSGSYSYQYVNQRLITMTTPAGLQTTYGYDSANRLTQLNYQLPMTNYQASLAAYTYSLDKVGNISAVTETQATVLPAGTYHLSASPLVMEAEKGSLAAGASQSWQLKTSQSGYTGTAYLQSSSDLDPLYQTNQLNSSPRAEYQVNVTTPGTYTVWLRGYPPNAAGDSVYIGLGSQTVSVTGFDPGSWSWASQRTDTGAAATLTVQSSGFYTVSLWLREDGLRVDRLLLTTDTTYIPTGFGPAESAQPSALTTTLTRTIVYTYDNLYRLTNATYSTGEVFTYTYDPAGNRTTQTTLAGTTVYTYDAANRLTQVDGQSYTWDNNGNLLSDGSRTFTYDTENRLTSVVSGAVTTTFEYNGDGDRYAQTVNGITTDYVLDPVGLAQVLMETTSGQSKHYLPGLAQYDTANGWQYVTSDRVGSVRLLVKPNGEVALSQSFDPFGNVLERTGAGQSSFGYTGEQTDPTGLVFLRARYYDPRIGRFLTADSLIPDPLNSQSWNRYAYVGNNPVKYADPSGHEVPLKCLICEVEIDVSDWPHLGKYAAFVVTVFTDLHYDFEREMVVGPTREEWLESALTACPTPIGMAAQSTSKGLSRAGRTLLKRARDILRGSVSPVRRIANRMPGASGDAYDKLTGQGVYVLLDKANNVRYVGRGDVHVRIAQHANDAIKGKWTPFIVAENNLLMEEARGLEQLLIEHYGGPKRYGGPLENEFMGIRYKNKNFNKYIDAAAPLYKEAVERIKAFINP
jgi:RHS repeat-associated protein